MRELKFRLVIVEKYPPHWEEIISYRYVSLTTLLHSHTRYPCEYFSDYEMHGGKCIKAKNEYTGLHDKNGKEIYEGDIVREPDNHYQRIRLVKWYDYGFKLIPVKHTIGVLCFRGGRKREVENKAIEVIGNIYENPELLKGEQCNTEEL